MYQNTITVAQKYRHSLVTFKHELEDSLDALMQALREDEIRFFIHLLIPNKKEAEQAGQKLDLNSCEVQKTDSHEGT